MPRVSVITPCYNAEKFLESCVASILEQSFSDLEMIVVDDGSTDDSLRVLQGFSDPRLRVLTQSNQGPAAARNRAVREARGDIIAFLDADDVSVPDRLDAQVSLLDRSPEVSVVPGGFEWIDTGGSPLAVDHAWRVLDFDLNDLEHWLFDCPLLPSAVALRREAWESCGGMDESLRCAEDWHLWMRMRLAGYRMLWLKRVVAMYRRRAGSLSGNPGLMVRDATRVLREIRRHPAFPDSLEASWKRALALRYLDGAKRHFAADGWESGRDCLAEAIALDECLLDENPIRSRVESELINIAADPLCTRPAEFLRQAFTYLPEGAAHLKSRLPTATQRCFLDRAQQRLREKNWSAAAVDMGRAVSAHPAVLLEKGAWRKMTDVARMYRERARAHGRSDT